MNTFSHIPISPPDPIFGVADAYKASPLKNKYILAVGIYCDEKGRPFVFPAVRTAEKQLFGKYSKDYLPLTGHPGFIENARKLLWGPKLAEHGDRISTTQSVSGTGALFNIARFSSMHLKFPSVLVSNPSWPNYVPIFSGVGHKIKFYPYLKKDSSFDLDGCCDAIKNAPRGSLAIFQACAHNPTGVDPSPEQWNEIFDVCEQKDHKIVFDFAYMGYASGDLEKDCQLIRDYIDRGRDFFVSFSFSKCMGLYGERIGALHVITKSKKEAVAVTSQIGVVANCSVMVPPQNGALIVNEILSTPSLKKQWLQELKEVGHRVIDIRGKFVDHLEEFSGKDWEFIRKQRGMFALTGLNTSQVHYLGEKCGVFIAANGRITIPALNHSNVKAVAKAVADASNH